MCRSTKLTIFSDPCRSPCPFSPAGNRQTAAAEQRGACGPDGPDAGAFPSPPHGAAPAPAAAAPGSRALLAPRRFFSCRAWLLPPLHGPPGLDLQPLGGLLIVLGSMTASFFTMASAKPTSVTAAMAQLLRPSARPRASLSAGMVRHRQAPVCAKAYAGAQSRPPHPTPPE